MWADRAKLAPEGVMGEGHSGPHQHHRCSESARPHARGSEVFQASDIPLVRPPTPIVIVVGPPLQNRFRWSPSYWSQGPDSGSSRGLPVFCAPFLLQGLIFIQFRLIFISGRS